MKIKLRTILLIIVLLILSFSFLNYKGILSIHNVHNKSNEPNLKKGTKVISSNMVSPKNGDFICYKNQNEKFGDFVRIHRLCGMENDIIEIKNGTLFINGNNADKGLDFIHFYKLAENEYNVMKTEIQDDTSFISRIGEKKDTIVVLLKDSFAKTKKLESRRWMIFAKNEETQYGGLIKSNLNNYGPIKVPTNKYFVLGDNRDISEDSRYIGLIDKNDIVGTVIIK